MRGVTFSSTRVCSSFHISTHTPHARRDHPAKTYAHDFLISTHTPHARRDLSHIIIISIVCIFQLTRLMRGVTKKPAHRIQKDFISTHTPHARRDKHPFVYQLVLDISTHTPHARRDDKKSFVLYCDSKISTHTPHARRDLESASVR